MANYAIDLFSGTGSATKYFRRSEEWTCRGIDINPERPEDTEMNIFDFEPKKVEKDIDFIWASPPCKSFSLGGDGSWHKKSDRLRMPRNQKAYNGIKMVFKTLQVIRVLEPEYWFLENPRGGLRGVIGEPQHDRRREQDKHLNVKEQKDKNYFGSVTYCQYGDDRMKPTDLWGVHPKNFSYEFCGNGEDCHVSASRGSQRGTQGRSNKKDRWKIPEGLAKHVFETVNDSI